MIIKTYVENKYHDILSSLIGQLSDGIWESNLSNEKYWKNVSFEKQNDGYCILNIPDNLCTRAKTNPASLLKKYARFLKKAVKLCIIDDAKLNLSPLPIDYFKNDKWFNVCNKNECGYLSSYVDNNVNSIGDCAIVYNKLRIGIRVRL